MCVCVSVLRVHNIICMFSKHHQLYGSVSRRVCLIDTCTTALIMRNQRIDGVSTADTDSIEPWKRE